MRMQRGEWRLDRVFSSLFFLYKEKCVYYTIPYLFPRLPPMLYAILKQCTNTKTILLPFLVSFIHRCLRSGYLVVTLHFFLS